MRLLSVSPPMDTHDALLPTQSEVRRLSRAGPLGTVFRIDFKGHRVAATVCELGDIGHGGAMQRAVATAAASDSHHALRLIDVALVSQSGGSRANNYYRTHPPAHGLHT